MYNDGYNVLFSMRADKDYCKRMAGASVNCRQERIQDTWDNK